MSRKAKSTIARDELEQRIGYTFADKSILDRALTHVSAASPKQGRGGSYQRLEFLGDHVLGSGRDVWGDRVPPRSQTLDVHIRWLRQKVETNPRHPQYILTVHGMGYKFVG